MFGKRKPRSVEPRYSVVGTVYVRAAGLSAYDATSPHHITKLRIGTEVTVVDRHRLRDGSFSVRIMDGAGRTGTCGEREIWEHVGTC